MKTEKLTWPQSKNLLKTSMCGCVIYQSQYLNRFYLNGDEVWGRFKNDKPYNITPMSSKLLFKVYKEQT